ncbi:IS66-like element accessory protein TnpA [Caldimonas brevitalea]|uniref:Transposase n=1 Tax=Caldimonas brevitalea TaxID=413882 RepID=A0A0G3BMU0_9BURK|nr:transposase [Caldimonas brevitalea]AKJ30747.1 hypothetical protein AAW51_4056 [Caldimonas brevitalea]
MDSKPVQRRRHSRALKTQVLVECDQPGASVAAVSQSHGLNANLVHKWRRQQQAKARTEPQQSGQASPPVPADGFVPLQLSAVAVPVPPPPTVPDIRIELRRGATTMVMSWPAAAAVECGAWLREWLK